MFFAYWAIQLQNTMQQNTLQLTICSQIHYSVIVIECILAN